MARRMLDISAATPGEPTAMIIGTGHTDRVIALLKQKGASFALLTPKTLEPKPGSPDADADAYSRKDEGLWARIGPGTIGGVLNGKHKPAPTIETETAHSYASLQAATIIIARAHRRNKKLPGDISNELAALPEIVVNLASFEQDGKDILFSARLNAPDGREQQVWARVGIVATTNEKRNLEQKLQQNVVNLESKLKPAPGGGGIPPGSIPGDCVAADDEGPGDYRTRGRGDDEVIVERLTDDVVGIYGKDRNAASGVGRLGEI